MKDATTELLLCALKRGGEPATAGDVCDVAVGLAMEAGWPRRSWSTLTVQGVAKNLLDMHKRGEIARVGERPVNGRKTPEFAPNELPVDGRGTVRRDYNPTAAMPFAPDPEGEDHPLHGRTKRQQYVLFDVLDTLLATSVRQQTELVDLLQRQQREIGEHAARMKRELLAAGFEELSA